MVDGLVAAIVPEAESGYGVPGEDYLPPQNTVDVMELRDGASLRLDGFTVTVAENTHYSDAVTALSRGADLLVTELADPAFAATFVTRGPGPQPKRLREMHDHMVNHYISPDQVGQKAEAARVRRVVITHLVAGRDPNVDTTPLVIGVQKWFTGPVEIAADLKRY